MSLYEIRVNQFQIELSKDIIDINELKNLCFNGVPDEKGLRSLCWKYLLNYLPLDSKSRKSILDANRKLYNGFIEEMIVSPGGEDDHPLNVNPSSSWSSYFKDNEVILQIDKDVRRLCPDISFFQIATEFPCLQVVNSCGVKRLHKRVENAALKYNNVETIGLGLSKMSACKAKNNNDHSDYNPLPEGSEAHWEVVERMLFLYAKLNPGQGYVQGMNEIIGPIYHTFASDPDPEYRKFAEADCFYCFTNLMSEIRDFFIQSLDDTESGIVSLMERLGKSLHNCDIDIWKRFEEQDLKLQYYSFRWLTLLLSQEFSLPDVERIWDSLFADRNRFNFLIHICCAMIILVKDQVMVGDFATNLKLLQKFPPMDVSLIVATAVKISQKLQ